MFDIIEWHSRNGSAATQAQRNEPRSIPMFKGADMGENKTWQNLLAAFIGPVMLVLTDAVKKEVSA